jgi:acetolactate synthase-1/2/3 large subunit
MHGQLMPIMLLECDLIALGARFDDRVTGKLQEFACDAEVMHIDIDAAEISKNRYPQLVVVGDVVKFY